MRVEINAEKGIRTGKSGKPGKNVKTGKNGKKTGLRRCFFGSMFLLLLLFVSVGFGSCGKEEDKAEFHIVSVNFAGCDFVRTLAGRDNPRVSVELFAGGDIHSFNPTFGDMVKIQSADLFLYVGGESDAAIDTLLASLPEVKTFRMVDHVPLLKEEIKEGMEGDSHEEHDGHGEAEEDGEYDEHVWTSLKNAVRLVRALEEELVAMDPAGAEVYRENAETFVGELEALDGEFTSFFASLDKKLLIFGDRFPFRYFAADYGLDYYAAFPGCSASVEPGPRTVTFLLNKAKEEGVTAIYHIEGDVHSMADRLAQVAGIESVLLHSCHKVSREEMEQGVTFLSLMRENLAVLKRTLS